MDRDKIRICQDHRGRTTPLIFMFLFPGCEYWCPYCGIRGGMFGTGEVVVASEELKARLATDKEKALPYLSGAVDKYEYPIIAALGKGGVGNEHAR